MLLFGNFRAEFTVEMHGACYPRALLNDILLYNNDIIRINLIKDCNTYND